MGIIIKRGIIGISVISGLFTIASVFLDLTFLSLLQKIFLLLATILSFLIACLVPNDVSITKKLSKTKRLVISILICATVAAIIAVIMCGKSRNKTGQLSQTATSSEKPVAPASAKSSITPSQYLGRNKFNFDGDIVDDFRYGYLQYCKGAYDSAFSLLLKSANEGYPDAELYVGYCYRDGKGVQKNLYSAFDWFSIAAEQGQYEAQYNLGLCYFSGTGVEKNEALAFGWFQRSAEQNNPSGLLWTGYCYHHGVGVTQNYDLAYDYYFAARKLGNDYAQFRINELRRDRGY